MEPTIILGPLWGLIKIILQRFGILKDYKEIYKSEQKIKSLGNAFRMIKLPLNKLIEDYEDKIPCILLFRQKGLSFPTNTLKEKGFIKVEKSMGLYVMPPQKVKELKIENGKTIREWAIKEFGLIDEPEINLRFLALLDLRNIFSYKKESLKATTLWEVLLPYIIKYMGPEKFLKIALHELKENDKQMTERQIIELTPLQHIFADILSESKFRILEENENDIIDYLIKTNKINDKSYFSLSKIEKSEMKECIEKYLGVMDNIDEVIEKGLEQAKFISNKL